MVEKLEERKVCSEQSLVLTSLYLSPKGERNTAPKLPLLQERAGVRWFSTTLMPSLPINKGMLNYFIYLNQQFIPLSCTFIPNVNTF